MSRLVKKDAKSNRRSATKHDWMNGFIPLLIAALIGLMAAAPLVSQAAQNVDLKPERARSMLQQKGWAVEKNAFFAAVQKGQTDAVELFLASKMKPNTLFRRDYRYNGKGKEPLAVDVPPGYETPLTWTVSSGNVESVRLLLENGADPNLFRNGDRTVVSPPLNKALQRCGRARDPETLEQTVKLLLEHGADPAHHKTVDEYPYPKPFTLAKTRNCPKPIVDALIDAGADPRLYRQEQKLVRAVRSGSINRVKNLLKSDVNPNFLPSNPLMESVKSQSTSITKTLLEHGADPGLITRSKSGNPLSIAIQNRSFETVEMLISHGADPNFRFAPGSMRQSASALEAAIGLATRNDPPDRPRVLEITRLLLENGADPRPDRVTEGEVVKRTLLSRFLAAASPGGQTQSESSSSPLEDMDPEMKKLLIKQAKKAGNEKMLEKLQGGGDGSNGGSAFYRNMTELLLEHGVDPNLPGFHDAPYAADNHPLIQAVRKNMKDVTQTLLDNGADPTAKLRGNNDGGTKTPLSVAREEGKTWAVKMFES